MLKLEDLIRKATIIEEIARNHVTVQHDLLKLMKEILSPSAQDLLAGNKIQMNSIYKYIDV